MLLFGLLLLSTVLAAERKLSGLRVKVCIQEGKVQSLEARKSNETLKGDWRFVFVDPYVGKLFLDAYNITSFEKGWYRLQDYPIQEIDLDANKIVEITSEMLNDLPAGVEKVKLWGNEIERLRKGIIENEHLSSLDLRYNYIREIESGALERTNLTGSLLLNRNLLKDTKFAATLPPNLTELSLSRNAITEISDGTFSKLGKLSSLRLDRNKITALHRESFQGLRNLRYLDLTFNSIEKVENGTFEFNSLRKTILFEKLWMLNV